MPRLPDAAEIAYMEAHISDTRVPDIIACSAICGIASIIIITLRLVARMLAKAGMQTSDWLILFAWVSLSSCRSGDLQQLQCDKQLPRRWPWEQTTESKANSEELTTNIT